MSSPAKINLEENNSIEASDQEEGDSQLNSEDEEEIVIKPQRVIPSKFIVYYFGRAETSPFNVKELMKRLPRCEKGK